MQAVWSHVWSKPASPVEHHRVQIPQTHSAAAVFCLYASCFSLQTPHGSSSGGSSGSLGLSGTLHQTQTATCYSFIIYFAAPALIRHISTEDEAADEHAGVNICLQLIATLSSFDVLPFFEGGVDISYAALPMMKGRLRLMFLSNCLIRGEDGMEMAVDICWIQVGRWTI